MTRTFTIIAIVLLATVVLAASLHFVSHVRAAAIGAKFPYRLEPSNVWVFCDNGNLVYVSEAKAEGWASASWVVPWVAVVPGGCR